MTSEDELREKLRTRASEIAQAENDRERVVRLVSDELPEGQSAEDQKELLGLKERLKNRAIAQNAKNGLYSMVIKDGIINKITVEEFRTAFRDFGVTVNTYPQEDGRVTVAISWLPAKISEMTRSRGGRPTHVFHTGFTVGEIFNLLSCENPPVKRSDLYKATKMSKTTFYKRVAYYREHPDLNEEFH